MIIVAFNPSSPPLDKGERQSRWFLCLVETPSTRHWAIGRYDLDYKKIAPWRDVYSHPLKVTHYCELPELPKEGGLDVQVYEEGSATVVYVPGFGVARALSVS